MPNDQPSEPDVPQSATLVAEPSSHNTSIQAVPAAFFLYPVLHVKSVYTVFPHPVHCVVPVACSGTVTALQLDVHVSYLPLQHNPLVVPEPLFELSHLQVDGALHVQE